MPHELLEWDAAKFKSLLLYYQHKQEEEKKRMKKYGVT